MDKTALLPGETATLANYTSYSRGINGIMVDIAAPTATPTEADFEFKVGGDGTPGDWDDAPDPSSVTVRPGQGAGGSDRVTIVWPDNLIQKQWLQVTVLAENTGLAGDDVFYYGNAIGESGNSTSDAKVNAFDMLGARDNQRNLLDPAPIDFRFDYDRNARVDATDMLIARNHQTHFLNALRLISLPGTMAADGAEAIEKRSGRGGAGRRAADREARQLTSAVDELDWLHQFEQTAASRKPVKTHRPIAHAVDLLLAVDR